MLQTHSFIQRIGTLTQRLIHRCIRSDFKLNPSANSVLVVTAYKKENFSYSVMYVCQ